MTSKLIGGTALMCRLAWSIGVMGMLLCLLVSSAVGREPLRPPVGSRPVQYPRCENRFAMVPPGQERLRAVNVPAYPWLLHGVALPTYNWGYFGARIRPQTITQHGYYEDYMQWSFRPGQ